MSRLLLFSGERVERDVHRDLSEGRLQCEAAFQKSGSSPAWYGECWAKEGRYDWGRYFDLFKATKISPRPRSSKLKTCLKWCELITCSCRWSWRTPLCLRDRWRVGAPAREQTCDIFQQNACCDILDTRRPCVTGSETSFRKPRHQFLQIAEDSFNLWILNNITVGVFNVSMGWDNQVLRLRSPKGRMKCNIIKNQLGLSETQRAPQRRFHI